MSRAHRRLLPLFCLGLITLAACRESISSPDTPESGRPHFAQGDDGLWTVTVLTDDGDGTCDDTECTLREAIATAGSSDRIVFAAELAGEVKLTQGQLEIRDTELIIDGDGRIAVDGQHTSRVFDIASDLNGTAVSFTGLTIKNGLVATGAGGGISAREGTKLRLDHVTVTRNQSSEAGGGIHIDASSELVLLNSTVADNEGGVVGGGVHNEGEATVTSSTISGNNAKEQGGGLYNARQATMSIARSTISGNIVGILATSSNGGGVFSDSDGTLHVRSSTITGNFSVGEFGPGGGIYTALGFGSIANSIVAGNRGTVDGFECTDFKGDFISLGHNLTVDGNANFCLFLHPTDKKLPAAAIFTEVLEETLKNNGGPTETHALIVRGRAMDAGSCPGETEDQRGLLRPVDLAVMPNALDGCDIGAYEIQGPVIARTDLMVSQSASKTSVKAGDLLTYTVRVQNLGPELAPDAVLTNVLSSGVTFVSATHANGSHTAPPVGETGTVTWTLGDLLDQANETAEIKVTVRIKGKTSIVNTASVTADIVDLNPANNSASLRTTVGAGGKPK